MSLLSSRLIGSIAEVVDDEQVDRAERGHPGVVRVVESALLESRASRRRARSGRRSDVDTRGGAERVGDESLADADGTENDDVPMRLQKSAASTAR